MASREPVPALFPLYRSMGQLDTEKLRYEYGPDAPTVEALADWIRELLRERDELRQKLGRAVERLAKEALAWEEMGRYADTASVPVGNAMAMSNTARRRASGLQDFVRELLSGSDEPGVEPPLERERRRMG